MDDGLNGKYGPMIEITSHRDALGRKLSESFSEERKTSRGRRFQPALKELAIAAALVLVLVSIAVPLCLVRLGHDKDVAFKKESGREQVAANQYGVNGPVEIQNLYNCLDASGYMKGVKPTPMVPSISLKEAEKKAGIKAKLPRVGEITGDREEVYFDISASENPQISVYYSNGIIIGNEVWKEKPDYIAQLEADKAASNGPSLMSGFSEELIKVEGHQGILWPRVLSNTLSYSIAGFVSPPQLEWWDDGVKYHINSWNLGFTEDQLLEIAESMYEK
ncbi:MAG: hypothetical protein JW738_07500 [Actinobacteria bacterium]|nr:hypothetical protein [Actinomycetota bacterium]